MDRLKTENYESEQGMSDNYGASGLWDYINQNNLKLDHTQSIDDFKSNKVNYKISVWNPKTNGLRYLKTLIYNLCQTLTPETWKSLNNIKNRDVGNPINVKFNNEHICMDYLQAVFELEFINKNFQLDGTKVLEIGAGYGRTCHAIMSNHDVIAYYIVDLLPCLTLSQKYLEQVLEKKVYSKIKFVPVEKFATLSDKHVGIGINIDSFAEMKAAVVKKYLKYIADHCDCLYVKNPVGKYFDKSLVDLPQDDEVVQLAMSTGLLLNIIDIFDSTAIQNQRDNFVKAYQPCDNWECSADSWAIPWSYYWQALYRTKNV